MSQRLYPLASNRDIGGLRSIEGTTATFITFVNTTTNVVNVDWINYQGKRQRYKTLGPNETYRQATFVTHPWEILVRGRATIFLPSASAEYIAFIGSTDNPILDPLPSCEDLRSTPGVIATILNFFNLSNSDANVFWIDTQGRCKFYSTVKPGKIYYQSTYLGHPWEVVVGQRKNCYMPIDSAADVHIYTD